jgi:hypothetical protein
MKHISSHLKEQERKKEKVTERGELMRYFVGRLNRDRRADGLPDISMARMGRIVQAIPTKDLYYLKRVCEDAKHFSKKFWWEVNPKKHENGGR